MTEQKTYSYAASVKSGVSDELINTYLIRPLAGVFVRCVYTTGLTPNHVTVASTLAGLASAFFYFEGTASANLAAGLLVTAKDVLDSADGQLARAKSQYSRAGRFLDSIGDFLVNVAVFCAIAVAVSYNSGSFDPLFLGVLAFLGTTLRVSYHVFYHTSFLHVQELYSINRITEEIRNEDRRVKRSTLYLQRVFQFLYGWQDRSMVIIDRWCRWNIERSSQSDEKWFTDRTGVRLSGMMGLGTELFLLTLFSAADSLEQYLIFNVVVMNAVWIVSVLYRRVYLRRKLSGVFPRRPSDGR